MSVIKSDQVKNATRVIWPSLPTAMPRVESGSVHRLSGECYAAVPARPLRLVASGGTLIMPLSAPLAFPRY
jgi:hypothetical protein